MIPSSTTTCHAIIGKDTGAASGPEVLVLAEARGLVLPCIAAAGLGPWFDVAAVDRAFHHLLGLRVTVLRCLEGDVNTHEAAVRIYAMEGHDPGWTLPTGARWITRAELDTVTLAVPEHRAVVAAWLDEATALGEGSRHAPWTRLGWLSRVEAFVSAELATRGMGPTAPLEQLRTWQRSSVLRARTTRGRVIFKASPAMFEHEPKVTQRVAQLHPACFPEVLAIEARERWTLMRELEGRPLLEIPQRTPWADALRTFARIQMAWVGRVDELIRCGCPQWPLERLAERMTVFVRDTDAMLLGTAHGLEDAEARELLALEPELRAILEALSRHGLPLTLEHGDLRSVQVVTTADGPAFFDLSDSAVTHPFFSAVTLLDFEEIPTEGTTVEAARAELRDAYLEVWTDHAPLERLVSAYELARVVTVLYAALQRYDIILPHLEPKERWEFMIPYWQRRLVHAVRSWTEAAP